MMSMKQMDDIIQKSGYKQSFIAEQMGMKPLWLSQALNGRRKLMADEYTKFCAFFGVDMEGHALHSA